MGARLWATNQEVVKNEVASPRCLLGEPVGDVPTCGCGVVASEPLQSDPEEDELPVAPYQSGKRCTKVNTMIAMCMIFLGPNFVGEVPADTCASA